VKSRDTNAVKEFYEKTAKDYDKEYEEPYWKLYQEITWRNIRLFLPKGKGAVILDAGGGTGCWTIKLAKLGYRVVLTDISENMLKVAEEKIGKKKLQGKIETRIVDIRDMSCFKSNLFDMALAEGDPVSYCLDPEKAVKELTRVVKPNAHVIVSVDSKYSLIPRLIAERSFNELSRLLREGIMKSTDRSIEAEFEFQAFTPEEVKALFENCGLRLVRMIGKPVLTHFVPSEKRNEIVGENFKRILDLETKFCDTPSLVGMGGHLEAVGIKQGTEKHKRS